MAHELSLGQNGQYEMAFTGQRKEIWHGLGQELSVGSSIETWTKEAGMDWDIDSTVVNYVDTEGTVQTFEGKQLLYRSDSKEALSIVSDRYKVVQPKEVLEFFRDLVSDAGMSLSTAGTLFGGKKFWALADTNESVLLNDRKDLMKGYLLLSTSCDGTLATSAQFTSVRVVCNNTLGFALGAGKNEKTRAATKHSTEFNPKDIKKQLGLYEDAWGRFSRQMERMTQITVSTKDAYNNLLDLFCVDAADPTNAEIRTVNEVHGLFLGAGMGADLAGQTAFGLLNAVTEHWDHHTGRIPSNIVNSNFWGASAKQKQVALDYISNKYAVVA
jgi:phage/plasmid-like protein (TIGR03299 family)